MSGTPTLDNQFSTALRAELMAQVSATQSPVAPPELRRSGLGSRRGGWLAPIAITAAAGLLLATAVLPTGDRAYAGWSNTPVSLPSDAAATSERNCSRQFDSSAQWDLAVAERRGSWTMTILQGPGHTVATCHERDGDGSSTSSLHRSSVPRATEVTVLDLNGVYSGDESGVLWTRPFEGHHIITGRAGSAVTRVVLHTSAGAVTASLDNGVWAAWWPMRDTAYRLEENLSAEVTLQDGRTLTLDRADLDQLHDGNLETDNN